MTNKIKRSLSLLLSIIMVISCFSGVSLTAFAAPTETLLTKITPTGKDTYSESVAGMVTVTLNNISNYYSGSNRGWVDGGTVTVEPVDGYTITKCRFIQDDSALDDDMKPFSITLGKIRTGCSVDTTTGKKTERYMDGVSSVEVYGYQTPSSSYVDGSGKSQTVNATELEATTTNWTDGSWYIVPEGGLTISGRITVNGTVNLILRDGATLTASAGITTTNATLNIYAQSAGTGALTAKGSNGDLTDGGSAGIGGNGKVGTLPDGYPIAGAGGTVNIYGGAVTATGGNGGQYSGGGAGIGGGGLGWKSTGGGCGTVSIYGGTVTATGGSGMNTAPGIGGGAAGYDCSAGAAGTLTIGKGVKLYSGTNNSGTVLDGSDSTERSYSGSRPQNMFAKFSTGPDKTDLNTAITAAQTLYDSIKDDTNYSTIAVTLKTAIDAAKEVADSETADQAAVDTANGAISDATTTAVVGMINALPASTEVTTSDKDKIEKARAAYDNLTDAQKEIVNKDASILLYLQAAEEALAALPEILDSTSTTWTKNATITDNLTIDDKVTVTADITLTIPEGKTLTVNGGIEAGEYTVTVAGKGVLVVTGTNGTKGTNGYSNGGAGSDGFKGNIIVDGATVTVTGGNGGDVTSGYEINASNGGNGGNGVAGNITVNSGSATVTGGNGGAGGRGRIPGSSGSTGIAVTGTLTLGKGVKLYEGTNNTGTVLDGNDSSSRVYSGEKKASMYAELLTGPDKTDLNTAITAAETLYDSIKDDTNYSTIAVTLKTAIDAAKEVADSETADQDAVDAAKTAITTAKTNAEAAKKDVDDTNAANAVITKINALPAADDVTTANKVAIEAARAAYNALTDDQKKKVDTDTLKKLTDAEAALKDAVDTETAQTATETINSLPDADKVTTADKDAIEAARKAYNDLTDDQKKKVSDDTLKKLTDAEDALAAATVSEEIGTLPDADKITAENKAAIEAAKKAYDELTDEQKQYVDKTTKEKLETAVTALDIALLPAADEITPANKEAIESARKAYNALSDEQKSELGDEAKAKLEAAEAALAIAVLPAADDVTSENKEAIEAARKAYDALNDEQKASVGTAAKEKLEAAESALAIALLPTPSDVSAEDKQAIETARKAYDALNDKQKASVGKTAREKLEAAETVLAIAELPETDEITTEDKAAIEAARKAYNALNDAQKTLAGDEVKAKLEAAEVALTKALVEALPAADKVTAQDKDAIEEARKAYNALTDQQKLSVGEDAKAVLEAAEAALAIAELPAADKVTAEDKAAIEAAAKAYNALSDEQKEMVGEAAKSKLEAAKAALAIALLPEAEKVTSADKADIEEARKAYDALTDEQKSELGTAAKEKLEAAEVKLTKELISVLPSAGAITTADATDVAAAKETFDKLNDEQKKEITPAQKAKLEAAVQALSDAEVYEVRTAINKLPVASEVTAENEEAIKDARKAYDALTDEQKVFVGETAKSKLIADEAALDIAKLPAQSDVTADHKDDIAAARKTYDALTLAQKEELGENAKKKLDNAEVGLVERQLEALPTEVTGSEREAIEAARKAYDALTDEQKLSVNPEALKKLTDAEAVIDAAEKEAKDTAAANAVSDTINAIPAAGEVTPENKDAIEAARKAYEELTDDQKAKVTPETLKKLTDAETALKEAIDTAAANEASDTINTLPEADKVTTADKAAIEAARAAYDALSEDQKAKVPADTLKKLTDAEEALATAEKNIAAFNADKVAQKKAADKLAKTTDSAASKKLIANAKKALDNLAYDESKTPDENKAAQKAVVTKLVSDLKAQRAWEGEVARAKLNSKAKGSSNKKGFNLTWGAAPNADRYVVYAQYCDGKSPYKKIATLKGNVNAYSITKLAGKKVDTSKCVRAYVVAYRLVNGKYVQVAKSISMHIAGVNHKTHTNAKAITVKNASITLKVNKATTLKPTIVRANNHKKMIHHTAQFRYQSTNTRVAKVDANGKIVAVGKGTCTILICANNGALKAVKVTVK